VRTCWEAYNAPPEPLLHLGESLKTKKVEKGAKGVRNKREKVDRRKKGNRKREKVVFIF